LHTGRRAERFKEAVMWNRAALITGVTLALVNVVPLAAVNQNSAKPVTVVNFPNPQHVTGTVDVGNVSETLKVRGTVNVANLPAVQHVQVDNEALDVRVHAPELVFDADFFVLRGFSSKVSDVPDGVVLTDLVVTGDDLNLGICRARFSSFREISSPALASMDIPRSGTPLSLHLQSGLESHGNLFVQLASLDMDARCDGRFLWTGFRR